MTFNRFEIVKTTLGAVSIKDHAVQEIIHNPVGPWPEARKLYVGQCNFEKKLSLPTSDPLVILDIGLGGAFNALASIEAYKQLHLKKTKNLRPLKIISFESDLSLFDFKLGNLHFFPESQTYQNALERLRGESLFEEENIRWELHGALTHTTKSDTLAAEVIFFDLYSPKVSPENWNLEIFETLRRAASSQRSCNLITYSVATKIRTALFLTGFYVGEGVSSGEKIETTFAATDLLEVRHPLGDRWLARWLRSSDFIPGGAQKMDKNSIWKILRDHPQFKTCKMTKEG